MAPKANATFTTVKAIRRHGRENSVVTPLSIIIFDDDFHNIIEIIIRIIDASTTAGACSVGAAN
jgi:hypothetical protein